MPVTTVVLLPLCNSEVQLIRLSGMFYQLAGVCTVAWEIADTRRAFDQPTLFQRLWSRISSLWPEPENHSLAAVAISGSGAVAGLGHLGVKAGPNASVEERIIVLERQIAGLQGAISTLEIELDKKDALLRRHVDERNSENENKIRQLDRKYASFHTDGLDLAVGGVVLLFVGVIFGTIPDELVGLLKAYRS
jgi:hypothetical protein